MLKSIVVDAGFESFASSRVRLAMDLAARFGASLTGFSAGAVQPSFVSEPGVIVPLTLLNNSVGTIQEQLGKLEAEFRRLAEGADWIGEVDDPTSALAREAAAADLVVTSSGFGIGPNHVASVDGGDLAVHAGRPVLIVPPGLSHLAAERILVAWKDTREARRSLKDALPLLSRARTVTLAGVVEGDARETGEGLARAARYLATRGIEARVEQLEGDRRSSGERILEAARLADADLIVSGAYGHSRFREWVFGGVTRSLLEDRRLARLMSS